MTNIISIILLIVSGAIFFFWINPTYVGTEKSVGVKQLLSERAKIQKKFNNVSLIEKKRKELRTQYSKLVASQSDAIKKLDKMIPDSINNARLINYIDSVKERTASTSISDVKIDTGQDDSSNKKGKIIIKRNKDYNSVKLIFSFTSQYSSFLRFLEQLYKSLRIVDIVSIDITPAGLNNNKMNEDKFKFTLTIRTY